MRKFNLDAALKGVPVATKDGHEVHIIDAKETSNGTTIVGWIGDIIATWERDGRHRKGSDSDLDLFLAGKDDYYINIYKDDEGVWAAEHMYETREMAVTMGEDTPYFYDTIKIEL